MLRNAIMMMLLATTLRAAEPATTTSSSKMPPATLVTLRLHDVPADKAFEQLFTQAGLNLKEFDRRITETRVTVEIVNQPFLAALMELCRKTDTDPGMSTVPGQRISLHSRRPATTRSIERLATTMRFPSTRASSRPTTSRFTTRPFTPIYSFRFPATGPSTTRPSWVNAPVCVAGPFMIVPQEATRRSYLAAGSRQHPPHQSMTMVLQTMCDPRLVVYEISNDLEIEIAQDDAGNSLIPDEPREIDLSQNYQTNAWMWVAWAHLKYPAKPGGKLALLRGKIAATVVSRSERITLDKIDNEIGARDAADMRVIFGKLEETRTQTRLAVVVPRGPHDDESWKALRSTLSSSDLLEAVDANGRRLWVRVQWNQRNEATLNGHLIFTPYQEPDTQERGPSKPAKLIWNVPVEVSDVTIPRRISRFTTSLTFGRFRGYQTNHDCSDFVRRFSLILRCGADT